MSRRDDALDAFRAWLTGPGGEAQGPFAEADWAISKQREAFVFVPGDRRRANRLYVVLGCRVRAISPSTESLDDAYECLAGSPPPETAR